MFVKYIKCTQTNKKYSKDKLVYKCDTGGSLDIIYDYSKIKKNISWEKLRKRPFSHWRYKEFYPIINDKNLITLDAGGTPLVESKKLKNIFFKCENINQTGSFKDRGTSLELSKMLEFGKKNVIAASTGNMGASIAAYSAAAGIKATIYVPKNSPKTKIQQIINYGANVVLVNGDYNKAEKRAYEDFRKGKGVLMGDYAYRGEGTKSVGFEIMDELPSVDYIFCCVGNGNLISGVWKGIKEIKLVGLIKKLPKLVAVQVEGCNPIVEAFNTNSEIKAVNPKTICNAIACGDPLDGDKALIALKESNGLAISVSDKDAISARRELARKEGIDAEPSGAVPYAGYLKLKNKIKKNSKIVILVTGNGLKDMKNV